MSTFFVTKKTELSDYDFTHIPSGHQTWRSYGSYGNPSHERMFEWTIIYKHYQTLAACQHLIHGHHQTMTITTTSLAKWSKHMIHAMWGPRSIAKLVQITPITMVYGTYNELVTGAFVNQLITWGASHCVTVWMSLTCSNFKHPLQPLPLMNKNWDPSRPDRVMHRSRPTGRKPT